MGRATRWLRSLWGGKKESKDSNAKDYSGYGGGEDKREKKRWSFGKPARDAGNVVLGQNASTAAAVEAAWFRSFYAESEKEQSKHAIAVAAATAAAADAAVAAAQAAVAVVRLTSHGRGTAFVTGSDRHASAVKIQTAFRRCLAKKAFRALKALVKLQALVRGYLVRKQATATLHSMLALIRAQAAVRAQRARNLLLNDRRVQVQLEFRPRRSLERFDETRSENPSSLHSRRLSASLDNVSNSFDKSPKIVEIDTGRPKSRSSRRTSSQSVLDPGDDLNTSFVSSPLPIPARISIPDCQNFQDYDWYLAGGDKCRVSVTTQSTPRYLNSCGGYVQITQQANSVCEEEGGVLRRFLNCPSYMANTQSFEAKLRSQSAPRQRPEPAGMRKRLPLSEVAVESMMQRCFSRAPEAFSFKSAVVGKLDRSAELGREAEGASYLQRKW